MPQCGRQFILRSALALLRGTQSPLRTDSIDQSNVWPALILFRRKGTISVRTGRDPSESIPCPDPVSGSDSDAESSVLTSSSDFWMDSIPQVHSTTSATAIKTAAKTQLQKTLICSPDPMRMPNSDGPTMPPAARPTAKDSRYHNMWFIVSSYGE